MQQMGVMNARLADFERQGVHLDGNAGDPDQDFEDAATVGIALNNLSRTGLSFPEKVRQFSDTLGSVSTSNKYACPEGLHKGQER